MKSVFQYRFILVLCVLLQLPGKVFGWGAYGHETINYETLGKIKDTEIGKCLLKSNLKASVPGAQNIPGGAFVEAAISPDYFWKTVGTPPRDPALVSQQRSTTAPSTLITSSKETPLPSELRAMTSFQARSRLFHQVLTSFRSCRPFKIFWSQTPTM